MYSSIISDFIDENRQKMVNLLMKLIEIPSVKASPKLNMPYGENIFKVFKYITDIAGDMGFEIENYENRIASIKVGGPEKLGILCHLDVVAANAEAWRTPPFCPTIKENMIYGRGAYDNKGPAAAALYALYALKELEIPMKHGVKLYFGTDEEHGSDDFKKYLKKHTLPEHVFVPDSRFSVGISEKGLIRLSATEQYQSKKIISAHSGSQVNIIPDEATAVLSAVSVSEIRNVLGDIDGIDFDITEADNVITVKINGKSAHASCPSAGINAATAMIKLLAHADGGIFRRLAELFGHGLYYGEGFGFSESVLSLSLTILDFENSKLKIQTDSRVALNINSHESAKKIAAALPMNVKFDRVDEPHSVSKDEYIVKKLTDIYKNYTGRDDVPYEMSGLTYAHNVPNAVVFGAVIPGDGSGGAHGSDECFNIDTMVNAAKLFASAITEICN